MNTLYNVPASLFVAITASIISAVSSRLAREDHAGAAQVVRSAFRVTAVMAVAARGSYALLAGLGNSIATVLAVGIAVVLLRCISREDLLRLPKGKKIADLLRLP